MPGNRAPATTLASLMAERQPPSGPMRPPVEVMPPRPTPGTSSSIPDFAAQLVSGLNGLGRGGGQDAPPLMAPDPAFSIQGQSPGVSPSFTDWAKRRAVMRMNRGVR